MCDKDKLTFLIENIKGVGPAKAEKIVKAFNDVEDLLYIPNDRETYEKLSSIVGISLTRSIIEQIEVIRQQDSAIQLMVFCGIPYYISMNIAKTELLFKAFKDDPYIIGRQNKISFPCCDKFAHILLAEKQLSPDMCQSRMQYFIEDALLNLENSGHTFAYLSQLVLKLNQYQKKNEYLPDDYEESTVILYLLNNDFVEVEKHANIKKWRICRKVTADLESDIAYHIKRLSANIQSTKEQTFISNGIEYDDVQLEAICSASKSGLKIITGPPGSGKTAVVKGIISYYSLMKPDAKIILCAPTGRAAKHMTEVTEKKSSTIHKLLGISESQQFIKKKTLECDMIICDEASMLNLDITYELLSRIKTGTVVYFIGDKNQLPAVGPGNVLHDIINSKVVPVYHLTKVYRQDGIILENAHEVNRGNVPTKTSSQYIQQSFESANDLKNAAIEWFTNHYETNEPFETQILVPSYKTDCGIIAINTAIQSLNPENYIYMSNSVNYKRYDKILMTKNNKEGLYQNGSVGILLSNMGDELLVEFDGEEVSIPKASIEDMTLGYAISVHKSQGSEFKHVLLCLPEKPVKMLKRNIVYTAITRAKLDLTICEMSGTLKKAVDSNPEIFMQTNLKEKLLGHFKK